MNMCCCDSSQIGHTCSFVIVGFHVIRVSHNTFDVLLSRLQSQHVIPELSKPLDWCGPSKCELDQNESLDRFTPRQTAVKPEDREVVVHHHNQQAHQQNLLRHHGSDVEVGASAAVTMQGCSAVCWVVRRAQVAIRGPFPPELLIWA